MKEKDDFEYPVWERILIFMIGTPLLLGAILFFMPIICVAMLVGAFWLMLEFLIYGASKTDFNPMKTEKEKENEKI